MGSISPLILENRLYKGLGRPVSRILLYPVIHLRGNAPGPLRRPRLPARRLRRDILACSHRSFTWPVPRGIPPVGSYPTLSPITCARWSRTVVRLYGPSAGLLSVALDVAAGLRRAAPRIIGPSGLSDRKAPVFASPDFALHPGRSRDTATGRTAQTLLEIIPQLVRC